MRQDVIMGQNRAANIDLSLYAVSWRIQVQVIARRPFPRTSIYNLELG